MEIKDYVKQLFAKQSDKVERRDLPANSTISTLTIIGLIK